jgi:hypothetical protein
MRSYGEVMTTMDSEAAMESRVGLISPYLSLRDVLLVVREVLRNALGVDVSMLIAGLYYWTVQPMMACGYSHLVVVTDCVRVIACGGPDGIFAGYPDSFCKTHREVAVTADMMGVLAPGRSTMMGVLAPGRSTMMREWGIIGIVCGGDFAMMYSANARYTWGVNSEGGLGIGHSRQCIKIKCVKTHKRIVSAACGADLTITLCVDRNGGSCVTGWGSGFVRKPVRPMGMPYTLDIQDPCAVTASRTRAFVLARGRVHVIGNRNDEICKLELTGVNRLFACSESCVIQITGGPSHVMFGKEVGMYNGPRESKVGSAARARELARFDFLPQVAIRAFETYTGPIPGVIIGVSAGFNFTVLTTSRGIYELSNYEGEYTLVCLYTF